MNCKKALDKIKQEKKDTQKRERSENWDEYDDPSAQQMYYEGKLNGLDLAIEALKRCKK